MLSHQDSTSSIIVLKGDKNIPEGTEQNVTQEDDTYTMFTARIWTQGPFEVQTIQLAN